MSTLPRIGDRITFQLYAEREVDGIVRAIIKATAGMKIRVEYGKVNVATIEPDQIIQPPGLPNNKDL